MIHGFRAAVLGQSDASMMSCVLFLVMGNAVLLWLGTHLLSQRKYFGF
jgi:hypothetical protein